MDDIHICILISPIFEAMELIIPSTHIGMGILLIDIPIDFCYLFDLFFCKTAAR